MDPKIDLDINLTIINALLKEIKMDFKDI